jgi:hypothetical protein
MERLGRFRPSAESIVNQLDERCIALMEMNGGVDYFSFTVSEPGSELIRAVEKMRSLGLLRFDVNTKELLYAYHWTTLGKLILAQFGFGKSEAQAAIAEPKPTKEVSHDLSEEEGVLLVEAAQGGGRICVSRTMHGLEVTANNRLLNQRMNPRSEALWNAAVEKLCALKLIEDKGHKREVFSLTLEGYRVADALRPSTIESTEQDEYDDNDKISLLQQYLAPLSSGLDNQTFVFAKVDREVDLPLGSAEKFLEIAAKKWDYKVSRKGRTTITFSKGSSHFPSVVNPTARRIYRS